MCHIPLDIHAHGRQKCGAAIVSCSPAEILDMAAAGVCGYFSAGIHPWQTAGCGSDDIEHEFGLLERVASLPQVVAIGETGLDALRGASQHEQERLFMRHVELSEAVGKPLVLHVVRTGHRIMEICKKLSRTIPGGLCQPWLWHGFRGNQQQASQFLALRPGNYLSFGARFNPSALSVVPFSRLLVETDESPESIGDIMARVAEAASVDVGGLSDILASNIRRIFTCL